MDPGKLMRVLMGGSATLLAVVSMFWIQSKFDAADRKAAVAVVHEYRSRAGWTVPEAFDALHPGRPTHWSVETVPACLHHYERVSIESDGVSYQFMVDIDGPAIHPGNHESEAVLRQLDEARAEPASPAAPAAAPSASSSPSSTTPPAPPAQGAR
jgi:hypothetical protein